VHRSDAFFFVDLLRAFKHACLSPDKIVQCCQAALQYPPSPQIHCQGGKPQILELKLLDRYCLGGVWAQLTSHTDRADRLVSGSGGCETRAELSRETKVCILYKQRHMAPVSIVHMLRCKETGKFERQRQTGASQAYTVKCDHLST